MELTKFQKYSWCLVGSFIFAVTLQYFSSSDNTYLSQQGFQKFSELNNKYQVNSIEALVSNNSASQGSFTSLLEASVFNNGQNATTLESTQESGKKLLFKLKNQEDDINNILALNLPESSNNLAAIAAEYRNQIAEIEFIEPDYEVTINEEAPLDEDSFSILGNLPNKSSDQSEEKITIAVIDTGADILHPVLREHRWSKAKEVRRNQQDEDQNGLIDDKYGWDFINNNERSYVDSSGHGTHVSGIIAGTVAEAEIMPIKVIEEKKGNLSNVIRGIKYAVDNKADIINFSIGTTEESKALKTAVDYAIKKDVTIIAAAGNAGDQTPYYPAAYYDVIAVGATNSHGEKLSKSNHGKWVDIFAPGQNILSSTPGNKYDYKSGTSQAAAIVTAEIVKLKSEQTYLSGKTLLKELKKIFPAA